MNTNKVSYGLNEEEQEMIDLVREFAEQKVAPRAAEIDRTGEFPWDLKEGGGVVAWSGQQTGNCSINAARTAYSIQQPHSEAP